MLPSRLPLFVLRGIILPPRLQMPFFIFEQRYRDMVADAKANSGMIGLIQPALDADDDDDKPPLARVGCAGMIMACSPAEPEGCYHIILSGLCRFVIEAPVEATTSYRQADVLYRDYLDDLKTPHDEADVDREALIHALQIFLEAAGVEADLDLVAAIPTEQLVNIAIATAKLGTREKQALLEAATLNQRSRLLIGFASMFHSDSQTDNNHIH